jgi:hypothetical protein
LFIIGIFLVGIVTLPSCKDQTNQNFTSDIVFPPSGVSFSKQVQPLFQQTCVAAGCHGGSQPAANLNLQLDVWHSIINYLPPLVLVNNGSKSPLYIDISGNPQLMPPSQRLTQNQIDGVKKWIDEGANNN